jgi:hypothetical protein
MNNQEIGHIHVKIPVKEHDDFLWKARFENDSNGSKLVRKWIREFLEGRLT